MLSLPFCLHYSYWHSYKDSSLSITMVMNWPRTSTTSRRSWLSAYRTWVGEGTGFRSLAKGRKNKIWVWLHTDHLNGLRCRWRGWVLLGFKGQWGSGISRVLDGPRLEHHPLLHYFKALFLCSRKCCCCLCFKSVGPESGFPLAVEVPAPPSLASLCASSRLAP